jgi:hypothetical protein
VHLVSSLQQSMNDAAAEAAGTSSDKADARTHGRTPV